MGYIDALRERNAFVRAITKYLGSVFFPLTFALGCALTGSNGKEVYVPITFLLLILVLIAAVFADDNKVLLAPMLMGYYCIGFDDASLLDQRRNDPLAPFDVGGFTFVCICGAIAAIAIVVRLCLDGTLKNIFKRRGIAFYGIIAIGAAMLLNGFFSKSWVPMDLVYGAMIAFGMIVFYMLASSMLHTSKDPLPYIAKSMVATSFIAVFQMVPVFVDSFLSGKLFEYYENIGKLEFYHELIQLSWGASTIIGATIVLGIPAALYLARSCRFAPISLASAVILLGAAVMVDARAAIIVGALTLVLGAPFICSGKNKIINRISVAILFVGAIGGILYVHCQIKPIGEILKMLSDTLRFDEIKDTGRLKYWQDGWHDFLSSPVFGVGIDDGALPLAQKFGNVFSNMYHSIAIQFLAATGIVGFLALVLHVKDIFIVAFRKISIDRLLILGVPIMILAMSIVDNFFFYLNFQIIYCIFLALAEKQLKGATAIDK